MSKINIMKNMDFAGFSKKELIFSPIKAKDKSITSFEGNNIAINSSVPMFVKAAEPLSKNEGEKGKQYNKNSIFNSFFFIFSSVARYLLLLILEFNFFPPTFLRNKNKRKEPKQFPIHEYKYPKKNPKAATLIITKPTNGSIGKNASNVGSNMPAAGPHISIYFKRTSEYSINSIFSTIASNNLFLLFIYMILIFYHIRISNLLYIIYVPK